MSPYEEAKKTGWGGSPKRTEKKKRGKNFQNKNGLLGGEVNQRLRDQTPTGKTDRCSSGFEIYREKGEGKKP